MSLLLSLELFVCVAWLLTIYQAATMDMPMGIAVRGVMAGEGMAEMAMGGTSAMGLSLAGAAIFVGVWTVMMVAMMLPAAASMIVIFASAQASRNREVAVPTWIFVAGYILVWAGAGLVVYVLVQIGSEFATSLTAPSRSKWAPLALGITVAAAGFYQFTPLKRACLDHCRSPEAFVAQHWRDGRTGALVMGIRHGLYCFGCCWVLFAVLVAAGVMSMAWMFLLTLVVFIERMFPRKLLAEAVTGIALIVVGILLATGAMAMPWIA